MNQNKPKSIEINADLPKSFMLFKAGCETWDLIKLLSSNNL